MSNSILGSVGAKHEQDGLRIVIASQEKVGKTTLTCSAPKSLLVPLEVGHGSINTPKTKMLQTYADVLQLMAEIKYYAGRREFPYKTVIFDSVTALERLIHTAVIAADPLSSSKKLSMETAHGGYGKSYVLACEIFGSFLQECDILAIRYKINIVMTCHVFPSEVVDPTAGKYQMWDLTLHSPKNEKSYGKRELITQWADLIGFLHEPITITETNGANIAIGLATGRKLGLSRTPSYVAGNRFKVEGLIDIPKENGWYALAKAIYDSCGINIIN